MLIYALAILVSNIMLLLDIKTNHLTLIHWLGFPESTQKIIMTSASHHASQLNSAEIPGSITTTIYGIRKIIS